MSARVDGAANKARRLSTPQALEGRGEKGEGAAGGPLGGSAVQCSAEKKSETRRSGQAALQHVSHRLICMPALVKKKKKKKVEPVLLVQRKHGGAGR